MSSLGRHGRLLQLGPIGCRAHGICAEELPGVITLDEWGYLILAVGPIPPELVRRARAAAAAGPVLALPLRKENAVDRRQI